MTNPPLVFNEEMSELFVPTLIGSDETRDSNHVYVLRDPRG